MGFEIESSVSGGLLCEIYSVTVFLLNHHPVQTYCTNAGFNLDCMGPSWRFSLAEVEVALGHTLLRVIGL